MHSAVLDKETRSVSLLGSAFITVDSGYFVVTVAPSRLMMWELVQIGVKAVHGEHCFLIILCSHAWTNNMY